MVFRLFQIISLGFSISGPRSLHSVLSLPDEKLGIGVVRRECETYLLLSVDGRKHTDLERALRAFLSRQRLALAHDYLANNGDVRCLDYPLPNSAEQACLICQGLFEECYGVQQRDVLKFVLR
jgi:hypothetical protein